MEGGRKKKQMESDGKEKLMERNEQRQEERAVYARGLLE